nr:MAG TPA: hypothetical protein [Caudoviricetes sp.]
MGTTKSPSTGYSVTDYVKMVFGHLQMSNTKFAKRVGVTLAQVMRWLREEAEPAMANLWRMEEISGMQIKDYLPEVERGWKLLNTAREWRDGFVRSRMRAKGVQISQGRYRDALNGIVNDERLSASQLIKINNYYEWWRDEKGRKKPSMNGGRDSGLRSWQGEQMGRSNIAKNCWHAGRALRTLREKNTRFWISTTGSWGRAARTIST